MEIFEIVALSLSGLALFYASSMRLFRPVSAQFLLTYHAKPNNDLKQDTDLVNEIRGIGAVMFLGGIAILLGTVLPELRPGSFLVAVVIYVGVVTGRLVSLVLDAPPSAKVVRATLAELLLGGLNVFCLVETWVR
ncbi:MAG: DUF4345 domain-containing protein [Bacteroidota bacterium]